MRQPKPAFIERCSCGAAMEFWRVPEIDEVMLIRFRAEHVCPNRQPRRRPVDPKVAKAILQRVRKAQAK